MKVNGGVLFHDIGINKLIVFPESINGFNGQINLKMTED
jgi:hypothetical protein